MPVVDLSQTIDETTPVWPGARYFCCHLRHSYEEGCLVHSYELEAGCGTHLDAPIHVVPGGRSIEQLHLSELKVAACVVDISHSAKKNVDYLLSVSDLEAWESQYGIIPTGAAVLIYTGWAVHWNSKIAYRNTDNETIMHFPTISAEAASVLVERDIAGIGIDTLSPDTGVNDKFPVHELILGADKYIIENLTNLHQLPPTGATITALPVKIKGAAEAPARVIGHF